MQSLRHRLILVSLAATLLPLAATVWISTSLIDRSLRYATTEQLDRVSRALEDTARRFYQRERESLRLDALAGQIAPAEFVVSDGRGWPPPVQAFWESGEPERFGLSGSGGDHLDYMRRHAQGVSLYRRDLGGVRMQELSAEFGRTREIVGSLRGRDLRRGLTLTLLLLVGIVWLVSLVPLVLLAHRISRPIQELTAALTAFAAGDWDRRLERAGSDEVGRAVAAFNAMADRLRQNRDRLVYLTQMSSWQTLARKTAHELKNSLTPIRLTVEEMVARQPGADPAFVEQAAQIVTSEIETLERRVRAFSEFAAEPDSAPAVIDLAALVADRVALLRPAYPGVSFEYRLGQNELSAYAGADLVKSTLTNLLENAAEAAGPGGSVLVTVRAQADAVHIEVHDSGPGLSDAAAATLFEPTITFKKHGMGLGLSIARKNALLAGGDLMHIPGEKGGAGFRVVLPAARRPAPGASA